MKWKSSVSHQLLVCPWSWVIAANPAATLYFTAWQNLWAVKLFAVCMHRPRASFILKIVPNAKVYTEHSDLHVAPEKPSLFVSIRTLNFSAWRVRNVYLHDQNSLALMGWLFIFLFYCRSFYLQKFLLSEPRERVFFKWIRLVFVFLQPNSTSNWFETQLPAQHTTSVWIRVCMCVQR